MRITSNASLARALAERDHAGGSWTKLVAAQSSKRNDADIAKIQRAAEEYKDKLDSIER